MELPLVLACRTISSHALNDPHTWLTIAENFLCFDIVVLNLCQLSTLDNISLCYAFLTCMKAKISTCSQLAWWGFLTYTSIVNSKFWLTIFFLTFWFFLGGLDAFSLDCEHGWSTKKKKDIMNHMFTLHLFLLFV